MNLIKVSSRNVSILKTLKFSISGAFYTGGNFYNFYYKSKEIEKISWDATSKPSTNYIIPIETVPIMYSDQYTSSTLEKIDVFFRIDYDSYGFWSISLYCIKPNYDKYVFSINSDERVKFGGSDSDYTLRTTPEPDYPLLSNEFSICIEYKD